MKKYFCEFIKKEKFNILISLCVGFVITSIVAIYTGFYSDKIQKDIASKIIRFHVLANSNTDLDQNLKLSVRDGIIKKYQDDMIKNKTIETNREFIKNNLDNIAKEAEEIIKSEGYNYSVKVDLDMSTFPTKYYGDLSFPAGEYEALKIEIGEAKGDNWWCVMFPPLCFVDVAKNVIIENEINEIGINEIEINGDEIQNANMEILQSKNDFSINTVINAPMTVNAQESLFVNDNESEKNIISDEVKENKNVESLSLDEKEISKNENSKNDERENENAETEIKHKNEINEINEREKIIIPNETKEILQNSLSEDEYDLITNKVKVKFKIIELWQNFKMKSDKY